MPVVIVAIGMDRRHQVKEKPDRRKTSVRKLRCQHLRKQLCRERKRKEIGSKSSFVVVHVGS